MAIKTVTVVVDDLDGKELDPDIKPIRVSVDRKSWDIYLSEDNAAAFFKDLEKYTANAQSARGTGSGRATTTAQTASTSDASRVREWAKAQGHDVPDRGRIPKSVRAAYDEAN